MARYLLAREAPKSAQNCPVVLAPSGSGSHKNAFRYKTVIYDLGYRCAMMLEDDLQII